MKSYHEIAGAAGSNRTFQFDADDRSETYGVRDLYCAEPLCTGQEIRIHLHGQSDPDRCFSFEVDLEGKKVISFEELSDTDMAIAVEFATDMAVRYWLDRHRQLVRAWGLAQWDEGPPVVAEDRCYGFVDFDMQGELHAPGFEWDGTAWLVHDQYCPKGTCDCRVALLSFMRLDPDTRVAKEEFGVALDLRTGRPRRPEDGGPLSRGELRTLRAFQQEVGNWQGELGLRRWLLRKIAAKRLRPAAAPDRHPRAKVGRNDPCPCGSGRKHKKCCGLATDRFRAGRT